ncbi:MAG TPA: PrsW family intramembrane metalloprotease [Candidatus Dormibacteraeota bacterium]|nr:PrsW family intramembrane metalloprotease [Candidatus Dormibacteraeota bacterium]
MIRQAAYRRRWRPSRYGLAAIIGIAVVGAVVLSSVVSFAVGPVPARATLFGLPAIALVAASTVSFIRALHDHESGERRRELGRAAVLLAVGMFCWLIVLDVYLFASDAGPAVAAACALACAPTTAAGLLVVRRLDRNEKEPWRLVLIATAWGAIVSTSLVVWAEGLWDGLFTVNLVPGPAADASAAYSAGVFEELAKGTAVLLLYLVMRDELDDVVDGIVYGAAVGLGFNFMESVAYMTHVYATLSPEGYGVQWAAAQWYFRQVLGLFLGHATYTALIGAGIGVARQLPRLRQRVLAIACGFLVAVAAHFAWDAWQALVQVGPTPLQLLLLHARYVLMVGPFTAVLLILVAMGLQREGTALARHLRAEASSGLGAVLPSEVDMLMSPWQRLRARLAALGAAGPAAYVRAARLQTAQMHLAMEQWHRERHEIDEPLAAEEALRQRVLELR